MTSVHPGGQTRVVSTQGTDPRTGQVLRDRMGTDPRTCKKRGGDRSVCWLILGCSLGVVSRLVSAPVPSCSRVVRGLLVAVARVGPCALLVPSCPVFWFSFVGDDPRNVSFHARPRASRSSFLSGRDGSQQGKGHRPKNQSFSKGKPMKSRLPRRRLLGRGVVPLVGEFRVCSVLVEQVCTSTRLSRTRAKTGRCSQSECT